MNMTCRPAWPSRFTGFGVSNTAPRNTVNSSTLPMMPTGQAQTLRLRPPSALASPKRLPTISRHRITWSADHELRVEEPLDRVHDVPAAVRSRATTVA